MHLAYQSVMMSNNFVILGYVLVTFTIGITYDVVNGKTLQILHIDYTNITTILYIVLHYNIILIILYYCIRKNIGMENHT